MPKLPVIYNRGEGLFMLIRILSKVSISKKLKSLNRLKTKNGMAITPIIKAYNKMLI